MGDIRTENSAFKDGEYIPISFDNDVICYGRKGKDNMVLIAVNKGNSQQYIDISSILPEEKIVVKPMSYVIKII